MYIIIYQLQESPNHVSTTLQSWRALSFLSDNRLKSRVPLWFALSAQNSHGPGPFVAGQFSLSYWWRQQETSALPSLPKRLPSPFLKASNYFFSFCNKWNMVLWVIWLPELHSPNSHPKNPAPYPTLQLVFMAWTPFSLLSNFTLPPTQAHLLCMPGAAPFTPVWISVAGVWV